MLSRKELSVKPRHLIASSLLNFTLITESEPFILTLRLDIDPRWLSSLRDFDFMILKFDVLILAICFRKRVLFLPIAVLLAVPILIEFV
ncbi:hypothetical protein VNO77_32624 [Canavalia gladiata]|uniref:Uncharacterized protein n=1 Tax=Canavalia gladiata TaxID=3824 RepID=A0AAN9KUJ1_CANGL